MKSRAKEKTIGDEAVDLILIEPIMTNLSKVASKAVMRDHKVRKQWSNAPK